MLIPLPAASLDAAEALTSAFAGYPRGWLKGRELTPVLAASIDPVSGIADIRSQLVLSDIPVFRELWDGAATFFTPEEPADLARVANEIAADEELCVRLARAAQERSLDFLPGRQMAAMEALYGELIEAAAIRECA